MIIRNAPLLISIVLASCGTAPTISGEPFGGGSVASPSDGGADAPIDNPRPHPNDLCGTPRDAPDGTACGYDGLGYVWMHGCWYSCKLPDMTCEIPVLSEYCDPECADATKYLILQSCHVP